MPGVQMTNMQSKAVTKFVAAFLAQGDRLAAIHPMLALQLHVVQGIIENGEGFEPYEFALLVGLMDLYFEAIDEYEEIWPGLEQAYAKLTGHFPFDIPPYDRQRDCGHLVGQYSSNKQPHLGT